MNDFFLYFRKNFNVNIEEYFAVCATIVWNRLLIES